ncbi:hypothetical protein [uncultured Pontibacter sp.]|uniref:hypothetical protein n=1 Tax=uncultured Pontibacter sp. TaxID=453356 RepID=UPI00261F515D|nr:hypothetical protein [uncultured Pontibacter sp.]
MKSRVTLRKEEGHGAVDSDFRKPVLLMGFRVALYSLLLFTLTEIILLDAHRISRQFSEQSYTEYAQEVFLLVSTLIFYLSVRFFPNQAVVGLLLGGLFGMSLIREFDAFLDAHVARHTWKVLAYSLAIVTAFLVYKKKEFFWRQLDGFIRTKAFGIVIAGMLSVFIFSRLYGLEDIWLALMGEEKYMYEITRISEESVELLGYTLIMIGAIEYIIDLSTSSKRKSTSIS